MPLPSSRHGSLNCRDWVNRLALSVGKGGSLKFDTSKNYLVGAETLETTLSGSIIVVFPSLC